MKEKINKKSITLRVGYDFFKKVKLKLIRKVWFWAKQERKKN